jgi:hypothetical protein
MEGINKEDNLFHAVNTGGISIQLCIYMSVVLACWLAVMLMKLSLVHLGKLQLTWCVVFFPLIYLSKMGFRLSTIHIYGKELIHDLGQIQ